MKEDMFALLIVTDPITADIYKGLLEANGIPVFLRSDATRTVHPFPVGGLGDVEVLISKDQLAEAVTLIDGVEIVNDEDADGETPEDTEADDTL